MAPSPPRTPRSRPSLVWPVILIGIGVLYLLRNLGVLSVSVWLPLLRLWPLVLILLGIEILVGRRSPTASTFMALLIIILVGGIVAALMFFPNNPAVQSLSGPSQELLQDRIQYPLANIATADVQIKWNPGTGSLKALGAESPYVIAGTLSYLNDLNAAMHTQNDHAAITLDAGTGTGFGFDFLDVDWSTSRWELGLHPHVVYNLSLDAGAGDFDFDLAALQLAGLQMNGDSGRVQLTLPPGSYPVTINCGDGNLTLNLPATQAVRLEIDNGSGVLHLGPGFGLVGGTGGGDGYWETTGYEKETGLLVELNMGAGDVTVSR